MNILYFQEIFCAHFSPATLPVAQADCKLNPPVTASISSTSPQKYSPGIIFDSIVFESTSESETHPAVTNSSPGRRREMVTEKSPVSACTSFFRSSFEKWAAVSSLSIQSQFKITSDNRAGIKDERIVFIILVDSFSHIIRISVSHF